MKISAKPKIVSVIGAGSWGTSVAAVIAETHPDVILRIWAYEKSVVTSINTVHENAEFLPGVPLPYHIAAYNSLKEASEDADVVIIATPSKVLPDIAQKLNRFVAPRVCVAFLTKGFCKINDQILTISQTIEEFMPQTKGKVVAISGPSHAEEVSKRYHTCLNVASKNAVNRRIVAVLLTSSYIQCREKDDIVGVEIGGTLKNPAAIAAGIISVLPECGDNLAGALIAEALKEMIRLGRHFKAKDETVIDISGLGDLVATALSHHSRNRRFGQDIAKQIMEKGNRVRFMDRLLFRLNPKAVIEKMGEKMNYLAEGAYAIEPLLELADKNNISVPVYRSLYEVLLHKKDSSLLVETIKNPGRYEEIYVQTKMHITKKKEGLENVRGRLFSNAIKTSVIANLFDEKTGGLTDEKLIDKLLEYRKLVVLQASKKEKALINNAIEDLSKKNIEALVDLYIDSVVDNYSPLSFSLLMFLINLGRLFANSPFNRKKLQIEGNRYKLSSLSELGNVIYVLDNKTPFDFLCALKSIVKMKMPVPRFMVTAQSVSGKAESVFMKLAGGFIVSERKYANPVYRLVFTAYLSTLIEHGVPLLLYRYYGEIKIPEALLQIVKKTMHEQSVEVMLAPVSLAKTEGETKQVKTIFPLRSHLKGGMIYRFSDFVFLSEFTKEENKGDAILPSIETMFRSNHPWYAHTLMANVFLANNKSISKDKIEECAVRFMEAEGMIFLGKTKKMVEKGIAWLKRKKIIKRQDRMYIVDNEAELQKIADLF